MKISAQEEYGLRCLVQLANLHDGESLTLPQIAELEGISTANAGKLMWLLNKAGFVNSTRGTKGGYFLARPAGAIYLNEIIKVLDEDVLQAHCDSFTGIQNFGTTYQTFCTIHGYTTNTVFSQVLLNF